MPAARKLDKAVETPAIGKRKRTTIADYSDDASDKENTDEAPQPAKKRQAKKSTTTKTKATSIAKKPIAAKPKKSSETKDAQKLYTETLKALDKRVDELDRKVKAMNPNSISITTENYAISARKHLPAVTKLAATDKILAFNLLLSIADASHTDLDTGFKMCGTICDESSPTFKKLDEVLLPLIESRAKPEARASELPDVMHRWTEKDAEVGVFKTGRPNAQQRNQMYRQKLDWEKERRVERRERRAQEGDWVAVALADLKGERDYLKEYGVEGYLLGSIERLEAYVY